MVETMSKVRKQSERDKEIINEAYDRWKRCVEWESASRNLFLDDLKFANGDPDNGYQWPNEVQTLREADDEPCLTINKVRQHNLMIINDAKQNKPSVKIRPVSGEASVTAAKIYEGIVRRIEYVSKAQVAYDTATEFQVTAGIGWWRIYTDYTAENSLDQDIFIGRVKNPLNIFMDPDINERDGSDALFAFVFDNVAEKEFFKDHKEYKGLIGQNALGADESFGWVTSDHIRVAEYFRRVKVKDTLLVYEDPVSGEPCYVQKSNLPKDLAEQLEAQETTRSREVWTWKVEWFKIAGDYIIDEGVWIGKYIPLVRIVGEEVIIDGKLDRKGHTRNLKDAQRMYNYWTSAATSQVALEGKTPYVASAEAIEGYEEMWGNANRQNYAVLIYNARSDDGTKDNLPPQKVQPTQMAPAYLQGMQNADREMMMASGQWDAQQGRPSNERSGKAINERQRQGDNSTYHFVDNQAIGLRFTGVQLIDIIPKVYDTKRTMKILNEDGTEELITIDPDQKEALVQKRDAQKRVIESVFNPARGQYDVYADIGPAYATRRQEAFNAFQQIITGSPELMMIIGDLLFKSADFPGAEEIAERLRRKVPPEVLGEGPPPQVVDLQMQIKSMEGALSDLLQQIAEERLKNKKKDDDTEVNAYKAETERMKALEGAINPQQLSVLAAQLVMEALNTSLRDATQTEGEPETDFDPDASAQADALLQQMKQAGDGNWYVPDPNRQGKYLMVNGNG